MPITVHLGQNKKRKRMVPKFYGFHTFGDPGCPSTPTGPFRDNIRTFLRECAQVKDYTVEGNPIWCTFLVHENRGFVVPLYTIEETTNNSLRPFCNHCRCAGWSHHFVSKRKYHLIISVDSEWNKPLSSDVFNLQTHLLHGLIHCNGFGHLLCINGFEGGSKHLCGREIMDLWDRICTTLRFRGITVEDVSKKREMDLRLLHGVAYGHPWFGRWGYRFCRGSFGVTHHIYKRATEILGSIELDGIIQDLRSTDRFRDIKKIICCYRDLSETTLITVRDLLRFMLALKSRSPWERKPPCPAPLPRSSTALRTKPALKEQKVCRKFSNVAANMGSRWPVKRLLYTAEVIVDALKEKKAENQFGNGGMTRQEARDAARMHIGDTGLIDYVLKSMNNVIIGDCIVRRAVNPSTRVLEYSIQEIGKFDLEAEVFPNSVQAPTLLPGSDVYSDVSYVYSNVLLDYPDSDAAETAVQAVLDSKQFVKEWPFRDDSDELLRFICRLMPSLIGLDTVFTPGELIEVPLHATVGDLKVAIQNAMRDTYCVMDELVVTDIEELDGMEDDEVLFGAVESGMELCARGRGLDMGAELKYEGGAGNWTVKCSCGAQDDDGERMVACDVCEVWQHTRCSGIEDSEAVPLLFLCSSCCGSLVPTQTQQPPSFDYDGFCGSLAPTQTKEPPSFEYNYCGDSLLPHLAELDMDQYGSFVTCEL